MGDFQMRKSVLAAALAAPIAGLLFWAVFLALSQISMHTVKVRITGYDPRDLLSGHYIEFRIDWAKANCNQLDWNGSCPRKDFDDVTRYYVPESQAHELERVINNRQFDTQMVFAYSKRLVVAKELLIDGQPWYKR